jgi:hypothetical protein
VINVNKEDEQKRILFQAKVKELETLFMKESLDTLKDINLLETYGQENITSEGVVGQGDSEGQDGVGDSEETDD